ncbi:hypothetical protein SK128_016965 [Halocaridina rubra]|uniref:Uncharacterized protein n=1 Tax=Halocaridina rubra TaxID=373956 RepID=A0AAN8WV27_HALRR
MSALKRKFYTEIFIYSNHIAVYTTIGTFIKFSNGLSRSVISPECVIIILGKRSFREEMQHTTSFSGNIHLQNSFDNEKIK